MISERISDDIPPQIEILNNGYPNSNALLLFLFELKRCKPHKAAGHPTICDVINDVKLPGKTISDSISQIFDVIQSDVALQKQVH